MLVNLCLVFISYCCKKYTYYCNGCIVYIGHLPCMSVRELSSDCSPSGNSSLITSAGILLFGTMFTRTFFISPRLSSRWHRCNSVLLRVKYFPLCRNTCILGSLRGWGSEAAPTLSLTWMSSSSMVTPMAEHV